MAAIDDIFRIIKEQGASDLHMASGSPPMVRIGNDLVAVDYGQLTPDLNRKLLYELMTPEQVARFEKTKEIDFGYEIPGVTRLRCNIFEQRHGVAGVFRLIPTTVLTAEQLNLPKQIINFCNLPYGLVLVTGATGSGKSTTLAAMVNHINLNEYCHIITIEDPVEFTHRHKKCMVNQREIGADTHGFNKALRSVLRQDPDYVLVGELRDHETIEAALTLAETGHLTFGTLHTSDAVQTVNRIIDVFPSHQQAQVRTQLSFTLEAVFCQQLLPVATGRGRALAAEIMLATPAIRALIRDGKGHQIYSQIQTGGRMGMRTMSASLAELVRSNKVNLATAERYVGEPAELRTLARGAAA